MKSSGLKPAHRKAEMEACVIIAFRSAFAVAQICRHTVQCMLGAFYQGTPESYAEERGFVPGHRSQN
jgi:hypothetical protein